MKYKIFFIIIIIFLYFNVYTKENIEHFYVNASVLNVRNKPSLNSRIITGLKEGSIVRLIKVTDKFDTIEGIRSFWHKIETFKGLKGFVSGRYLRKASEEEYKTYLDYQIKMLRSKLPKFKGDIVYYRSVKKYPNGDAGECWLEEVEFSIDFKNNEIAFGKMYSNVPDCDIYEMMYKNDTYYFNRFSEGYSLKVKIQNDKKNIYINFVYDVYVEENYSGYYTLGEARKFDIPCSKLNFEE